MSTSAVQADDWLAGGPAGNGTSSAVLRVLCFGRTRRQPLHFGRVKGGFFAQLNSIADAVLGEVLLGYSPGATFHESTLLVGYGNRSLADIFVPLSKRCGRLAHAGNQRLRELRHSPLFSVATALLRWLYQWSGVSLAPHLSYAAAVHVRRGDKIAERSPADKIRRWSETDLTDKIVSLVLPGVGTSVVPSPPRVVLASDDNAFARAVSRRLERRGVRVRLLINGADGGSRSGLEMCQHRPECVQELLELVEQFSRARLLLLSSRSNVGTFLAGWWGAMHCVPPSFADLDGAIAPGAFVSGHFFCEMAWGSRKGLCSIEQALLRRFGPLARMLLRRGAGLGARGRAPPSLW